jgi:hypothetical protein
MKVFTTHVIILFGCLSIFLSCTDDNTAQKYSNTMLQSHKSAKNLDNKVTVQEVRKSIQEFYAANGRYPADLAEVTAFNGISLKNDHYEYDPETGMLTERQ